MSLSLGRGRPFVANSFVNFLLQILEDTVLTFSPGSSSPPTACPTLGRFIRGEGSSQESAGFYAQFSSERWQGWLCPSRALPASEQEGTSLCRTGRALPRPREPVPASHSVTQGPQKSGEGGGLTSRARHSGTAQFQSQHTNNTACLPGGDGSAGAELERRLLGSTFFFFQKYLQGNSLVLSTSPLQIGPHLFFPLAQANFFCKEADSNYFRL